MRCAATQPTPTVEALRALVIAAGQVEQAAQDALPAHLPPAEAATILAGLHQATAQAARAFVTALADPPGQVDAALTALGIQRPAASDQQQESPSTR